MPNMPKKEEPTFTKSNILPSPYIIFTKDLKAQNSFFLIKPKFNKQPILHLILNDNPFIILNNKHNPLNNNLSKEKPKFKLNFSTIITKSTLSRIFTFNFP
jgi:hypothetical protein